jgi:HTH-type transcriptional regulator / antitoxin HipB
VQVRSADQVGNLVRSARLRRRMSQEDLAAAAGVSRRWLINLEAGKAGSELGLVLSVLNALGLPLLVDTPDAPTHSDLRASANVDLDEYLRYLAGPR